VVSFNTQQQLLGYMCTTDNECRSVTSMYDFLNIKHDPVLC